MAIRDAHRRRWFWTLLVAFDIALCAAGAAVAHHLLESARAAEREAGRDYVELPPSEGPPRDAPPLDAAASALLATLADERPWSKDSQYVVDPVVGHRPRRSIEVRLRLGPLGGEAVRGTRRQNNLGLIRGDDLFELPGPPRLLLIGDSHLMGVVNTADNAAAVLERRLRAPADASTPARPAAAVLNASAGYYSLWQLVLRARTLAPALAPDVLVLAVFLGNDFLELEDSGRPHLDDALAEQPAAAEPPAETTSARLAWLGMSGDQQLFWQGLNQATHFHLRPERLAPVLAKSGRCLDAAAQLAAQHGARLVVGLLPSYDLVFPDRVASYGARAMEAVAGGANERLRAEFRALLAARSIAAVDLVETFRADGRDALYATDYHVWIDGHRLFAEALQAPIEAALTALR